ncbi:hypothetical protein GCM10007870_19990 [Gluconobacter kondonii]|uniref:Uncharacterized protein n=1 Tax=Gluconobacter kondonii TaxID=941463 RepID=A0ABQ5WTR3_9PROT|nr:hypothetical protein AA3266_2101 [Gluconobacter kondonii NBRC 3266]GLQ66415.1 hypothetical protein GCM10007870_19990 [Gluconobacter kondonii]
MDSGVTSASIALRETDIEEQLSGGKNINLWEIYPVTDMKSHMGLQD